MCFLALLYQRLSDVPLLLAANREEYFDRPADAPHLQIGSPRVICGIDRRAGGTWLGVNEHALVVAVTNRAKSQLPQEPRSRGALCRELLGCRNATEAAELGYRELASGRYAGANYLCADLDSAFVLHGGDRLEQVTLSPGWHFLTNGNLDDPHDARIALAHEQLATQSFADRDAALASASALCRTTATPTQPTPVVLRAADRGTVSSTLLALTSTPDESIYRYADGPPDVVEYGDFTAALHEALGARR